MWPLSTKSEGPLPNGNSFYPKIAEMVQFSTLWWDKSSSGVPRSKGTPGTNLN